MSTRPNNGLSDLLAAIKIFLDVVWPYRLLLESDMILNMSTHTIVMIYKAMKSFFNAFENQPLTLFHTFFDTHIDSFREEK